MAQSFRCLGCGFEGSIEGKRSWFTIALSIISFTWFFEFWYAYCPRCVAKINAISMFVIILAAVLMGGVLLYGMFAA